MRERPPTLSTRIHEKRKHFLEGTGEKNNFQKEITVIKIKLRLTGSGKHPFWRAKCRPIKTPPGRHVDLYWRLLGNN